MTELKPYEIPVTLYQGGITVVVTCATCTRTPALVIQAEKRHLEENYTLEDLMGEHGWEVFENRPECPLCIQDRKEEIAWMESDQADQDATDEAELHALADEGVKACKREA